MGPDRRQPWHKTLAPPAPLAAQWPRGSFCRPRPLSRDHQDVYRFPKAKQGKGPDPKMCDWGSRHPDCDIIVCSLQRPLRGWVLEAQAHLHASPTTARLFQTSPGQEKIPPPGVLVRSQALPLSSTLTRLNFRPTRHLWLRALFQADGRREGLVPLALREFSSLGRVWPRAYYTGPQYNFRARRPRVCDPAPGSQGGTVTGAWDLAHGANPGQFLAPSGPPKAG